MSGHNFPSNISYNGTPPLPFGQLEIVVAASTLIPLCVFGIIANMCSISAVAYSKNLRSTFYYMLISLSVSDMISAIISPLALYRLTWGYEKWLWTTAFCKIYWYFDIWTSLVTTGHILLFTIFRFVSILWPTRFSIFTLKRTKIIIIVIWILYFILSSPTILWFEVVERDRSDPTPSSHWASCGLTADNVPEAKEYVKIAYSLFLYLPIILVICFTIAIAVRIVVMRNKRREMRGGLNEMSVNPSEIARTRKENQIFVQLFLIVASFLLGYLPRTAYHFYTVTATVPSSTEAGGATYSYNWWFAFSEYLCKRISECLNPVFYNLSSSEMRSATKEMVKAIWMKVKHIEEHSVESHSRPTVTDVV